MQRSAASIKFIFLALVTVGLMYAIYYLNPPPANISQVKNGKIDISAQMSSNNSVNLKGQWLFFYNEFLSEQQIKSRLNLAQDQQKYINLPSDWELEKFDSDVAPSSSYGTYHLQIKSAKRTLPLAIKLPTIGIEYPIYVNGKLIRATEVSNEHRKAQILLLDTDDEAFSVTIHVNNSGQKWGLHYPLQIGDAQILFQEQKLSAMKSLFISGCFFAIAIYNLILFSLRRSDKLPLIFALLCLILGSRELIMQDAVILDFFTNLTRMQLIVPEYASFYLSIPLSCHFIYRYYPALFNKRILISSYAVSLLLTLGLIGGLETGYLTLVLMQFISPIYIAYIIWVITRAYLAREKGSLVVIVGVFSLAFCAINDILYARALISTGYLTSYGSLLFFMSQSYIAGMNFSQSFQRTEALAITLKKRNIKLDNLRLSLESQVKERTNALAEANLYLKKLAHTDALTGIPNRHGIQPIIEHEQHRFKRSGEIYSVAVIDLDYFKKINDQYGHDAGDQVLKTTAQVIKDCIRKQDALARWGGEEFIILLPKTNIEGAINLAEKIRLAISQAVIQFNTHTLQVTGTIGVSEIQLTENFEKVFKRADLALYTAKNTGRNRVIAGESS